MPKEVSLDYLLSCPSLMEWMHKKLGRENSNKFEELPAKEDVSFVMIRSNVSLLVQELDKLRKNPKKFICLNDDIDHEEEKEARSVRHLLHEFYESLVPLPSSFELKDGRTNEFAHLSLDTSRDKNNNNNANKEQYGREREQMIQGNRKEKKISLQETDRLKEKRGHEDVNQELEASILLLALVVSTGIILSILLLLLLLKVRQQCKEQRDRCVCMCMQESAPTRLR